MPKSTAQVLVVDDDAAIRTVASALLEQAGIPCALAASGEEALHALDQNPIEVVVTDLRMPGMGGMALLANVVRAHPEIVVIVLTAHATVELAVEAMKVGASDFLRKPFERDEVLFVVKKALAVANGRAAQPVAAESGSLGLLGDSRALRELRQLVGKAAASAATVLVRGETGTGKGLVARAIHQASPRSRGPFITLHCAALPETLLESELFGYERGAFTGAATRKPGRVELAQGGTLFLDEIGDVPLTTQVKLLRVLQERQLERVGGTETISVDLRFIAATHRPLEAMIADGRFREDLFYRLNVLPLEVPPLRERPEDIPGLVVHFAGVFAQQNGKPGLEFEKAAVLALRGEPWPGNVRQLENLVERLIVLADGTRVERSDVERELAREALRTRTSREGPTSDAPLREERRQAERESVLRALEKAGNNRSLAARLLGVSRRTFYNKLDELGIA
jgi:DNA-binding NtrC family response regulator